MPRSNPNPDPNPHPKPNPNPSPNPNPNLSPNLNPTLPQANNASLALVTLFDRTDLMAVNPSLGARVLGLRHGLHSVRARVLA